jgi:uncharacterized iron-regulated membrane protein
MRRTHRWGAIAIALPILLVIGTGILLQVKKQVTWVQPPTQRGQAAYPELTFDAMLEVVRTVPEAQVRTWDDIDRIDVQVRRGMAKVVCRNRWEVQIDTRTGDILQVAYRRSDLIESLHDGSFFGQAAKLGLFLPSGFVLFGLWTTGMYLWALPIIARRNGRRRRATRAGRPALDTTQPPVTSG